MGEQRIVWRSSDHTEGAAAQGRIREASGDGGECGGQHMRYSGQQQPIDRLHEGPTSPAAAAATAAAITAAATTAAATTADAAAADSVGSSRPLIDIANDARCEVGLVCVDEAIRYAEEGECLDEGDGHMGLTFGKARRVPRVQQPHAGRRAAQQSKCAGVTLHEEAGGRVGV